MVETGLKARAQVAQEHSDGAEPEERRCRRVAAEAAENERETTRSEKAVSLFCSFSAICAVCEFCVPSFRLPGMLLPRRPINCPGRLAPCYL